MQILYKDIESAAKAVSAIMAQPTIPCALEFIDGKAIDMIRDYSDINFPENAGAMLMVEVDGAEAQLDCSVTDIKTACKSDSLIEFKVAKSREKIDALWATRKALSPALRNISPKKINEEVVVHVSNIPILIRGLEKLSKKHNIKIVNFGHAGNGNIHVNLLVNPDEKEELHAAENCLNDVFDLVLRLNGTLSGEHGVGLEKRDFIYKELGQTEINLMREIKQVFDKNNILNPEKTLPSR